MNQPTSILHTLYLPTHLGPLNMRSPMRAHFTQGVEAKVKPKSSNHIGEATEISPQKRALH